MDHTHSFVYNESEAAKIGRRTGISFAALGVLIANILVTIFVSVDGGFGNGIVWFLNFDYWPSLLVGVVAVFLVSYFLCGRAAAVVVTRKKNEVWVGSATAITVLFVSGLVAGLFLLLQKIISGSTDSLLLIDFVLLPALILTFYGFLPASILGICFGVVVKKKASTPETTSTHEVAAA